MLLTPIALMSVNDNSRTFLCWQRTTVGLVNTKRKLFVKTAAPINQLRTVKISLCVEANIWTQERWGDQCSMSLPVFFLVPQDESVWASAPSLISHASICLLLSLSVCLSVSVSGHIYTPPSPFFYQPSSQSSLCSSPSIYLSVSFCFSLLVPPPPLPASLPQDCCVYSLSRSPPVEDGDVSRHCGYCGVAVGITAATSLFRNWQRWTRKRRTCNTVETCKT